MGRCWVSREVGASGSNHCIMLGPIPGGKKMRFCIYYSQVALVVKNPPTNAGDIRDADSVPALRKSPRGGHGNPLQYSCLEYPIDRGAWQATVHGVTKSQPQLKQLSTLLL